MTIRAIDLAFDENLEGYVSGSEISIIQEYTDKAGTGPRLHRHPYSETFIVRRGAALFTAGDVQLVVAGGQVLVVPALVAHKFEVLDRGLFESVHIHANDRFVTEWLE
ncbi:Cupin domain-containing protein [Diaminobutyricimonas aerilata]|uniref:Cupin domain-containing protein n=1 Tax=Diaminobutyricimonas aerilata TaxID=1162967 RepID=A0A2M9CIU5_9MICO|nr:cupin domain-containing protein [Diaminobutyricimonas aerilata]PJJ71833.1 Cupin domain-containing protein [Diaminobutyricimonas aerilata]